MDKLLPCLAISAAKSVSSLIRFFGMGMASSLPGKVANTICPSILPFLANQLPQGCLAITGTNGKSTTSGLLASILRETGYQVIHNRQGANLIAGITAAFIEETSIGGSLKGNFGLLEVDEAALPVLTKAVCCQSIVVTNLFRDQLDRYGELDKTAQLITSGIKEQNSAAILNADDPNVCNLPCPGRKIFYGLDYCEPIQEGSQSNSCAGAEISYCPKCGHEISYLTSSNASSLWKCSNCNYSRPELDFYADGIELLPSSSNFTLHSKLQSATINLPLPGLFNVYNATAAGAAAFSFGIGLNTIKRGLEQYETLFGRSEKLKINEHMVIIQLIKNPAGTSKSLASLANGHCTQVLIAINDNLADGRDISWLWDANFEILAHISPSFFVSGQRAQDMAVRLKYAGVDSGKITCIPSLSLAFKQALEQMPANTTLWVLPTYTALLEMQKILKQYKTMVH